MKKPCIVIGAGIAGLAATLELLKRGCRVTLLEARDRIGGRIYTFSMKNTSLTVEGGAEFIHGEMPLTMALLKRTGARWRAAEGEPFQFHDGQLCRGEFFDEEWSLLLHKLKHLVRDMSFADFLQQNFQGTKFNKIRKRLESFVEGYNAADVRKASALALRDEWSKDEDPKQFRPEGGYGKLVETLAREVVSGGGDVRLSQSVTAIDWQPGHVVVTTHSGEAQEASMVLITIPIGVLQRSALQINPHTPEYFSAANKIGFGPVVKFHLAFREPFWEKDESRKIKNLGFLFSDERVPTWWTQLPSPVPLLTGWLGGPSVHDLPRDDEQLLNMALQSVSNLFSFPVNKVSQLLISSNVTNWLTDPFACGAYSYVTLNTRAARKILNTPIQNTLYFAGEALDEGPHTGTVEAALSSGISVAVKMTSSLVER